MKLSAKALATFSMEVEPDMETVPVIFYGSLASVEEGAAAGSEAVVELLPAGVLEVPAFPPQLERIKAARSAAATIEVSFFIFHSSFLLFTSTLYGF